MAAAKWALPPGVAIPRAGESWVVWSYEALAPGGGGGGGLDGSLLGALHRRFEMSGVALHLLSPEMLRWQVGAAGAMTLTHGHEHPMAAAY